MYAHSPVEHDEADVIHALRVAVARGALVKFTYKGDEYFGRPVFYKGAGHYTFALEPEPEMVKFVGHVVELIHDIPFAEVMDCRYRCYNARINRDIVKHVRPKAIAA